MTSLHKNSLSLILLGTVLYGCGDAPCSHTPRVDTNYEAYTNDVPVSTECNQIGRQETDADVFRQILGTDDPDNLFDPDDDGNGNGNGDDTCGESPLPPCQDQR